MSNSVYYRVVQPLPLFNLVFVILPPPPKALVMSLYSSPPQTLATTHLLSVPYGFAFL